MLETNNSKNRRLRRIGMAAILFVNLAFLILAEFVAGEWNETNGLRENARMFRAEVAPLRINTLNLIPSLDHRYSREESQTDDHYGILDKRVLRTDAQGAIINGNDVGPGRLRVLFLGGSTTECNEVDEPYRFPSVVEILMRNAGLAVDVVNAGVRGNTTQDSINAMLNRPTFRNVDYVVLMNNINDRLRLALRGSYEAELHVSAPTSRHALQDALGDVGLTFWDYISYRSNLLFLARTTFSQFDAWRGVRRDVAVTERSIDFDQDKAAENRSLFQQNLRIFVAVARAIGAQPILMTQPLGVSSKSQAIFNEGIRQIAGELKAPLIDLDKQLPPNQPELYFPDHIHFSNHGSLIVGKIIAPALKKLVKDNTIPSHNHPTSIDSRK